jgi:RNA polymerase sigma factor (TIGR02999 family)
VTSGSAGPVFSSSPSAVDLATIATMVTRREAEVTRWLKAWGDGDPAACEALWDAVHDELRSIASRYLRRDRAGHTLQPTALVNEAYLRLAGVEGVRWRDRHHFFAMAASIMRRILVDYARHHRSAKRGAGVPPLTLDMAADMPAEVTSDVLAVDRALLALEAIDPDKASVVELRFFAGLSRKETAEVLGCSEKTVQRHWAFAKLWLYHALTEGTRDGG